MSETFFTCVSCFASNVTQQVKRTNSKDLVEMPVLNSVTTSLGTAIQVAAPTSIRLCFCQLRQQQQIPLQGT